MPSVRSDPIRYLRRSRDDHLHAHCISPRSVICAPTCGLRGGRWRDRRADRRRPGGLPLGGAFVAFNGLPFGGSSDDAGAVYLDSSTSAAPTAAGTALGRPPGAVARIRSPARAGERGPQVRGRGAAAPAAPVPAGLIPPARARPVSGPGDPGISPPPGDVAPPPIAVPPLPSASGPVTNAVQGVDGAAGTNLSGPTRGVTRAVDGVAGGALNRAGGAAGRPRLGTRAGGAVGGIAGGGARRLTELRRRRAARPGRRGRQAGPP